MVLKVTPADEPDRLPYKDALWAVQPFWVKVLACTIGLPAWLVLGYGVLTGKLSTTAMDTAAVLFSSIGALELVFVLRAFWRMDL